MRLQSKEIQTIIQIAKDIYGETVQVYLFGSRLNDEKRGGDIDLLVRSTGEKKRYFPYSGHPCRTLTFWSVVVEF